MLKTVVYVALLVSDQDKALDFYTNAIGLEKRGDYPTPAGPRFLTVGVNGQDFELVLWPGTPAKAELGSAVYTIEVEDCQAAFETLKSRGVKFEPPEILEFSWGYAARFHDPDGNLLQLREGKGAFRLERSADREAALRVSADEERPRARAGAACAHAVGRPARLGEAAADRPPPQRPAPGLGGARCGRRLDGRTRRRGARASAGRSPRQPYSLAWAESAR